MVRFLYTVWIERNLTKAFKELIMNKLYFILLALITIDLAAQEIDQVKFRIRYAAEFKIREGEDRKRQDEKILDIGTTASKFYSLWEERVTDVKDSVLSRGGNLSDCLNAVERLPYPRSYSTYIVYKHYPQKGRLTYMDRLLKDFKYEEVLEAPKWKMLLADSVIMGYRCHKAQAYFRGRTWNVWFTADIPIHDGPWKLCGLPGLILKADDARGDFSFSCIAVEKGQQQPITIRKRSYIQCSPETINKNIMRSNKDSDGYLRQFGITPLPGWDANGKPLDYKSRKPPVLLEYF